MSRDARLAWWAVIFSGAAAFGGFFAAVGGYWAAYEAHRQTTLASDQARLENTGVIVRFCDMAHSELMHTGDDLFTVTGASGDWDYTAAEERSDLLEDVSKKPSYFLECRFTNPTRVPIFNVEFYTTVSYHGDKVHKRRHDDGPFEFIEPGETRTVWIENTDNDPVTFHEPDHVQYYMYPNMDKVHDEPLLPRNDYYDILKKDDDPIPYPSL